MQTTTEAPTETSTITITEADRRPVGVLRSAWTKALGALSAALMALYFTTGVSSAQVPTELSDGIDSLETNLLLIPALLIGAAVAIGIGFLFVRVTPKVIRWVSARFG